MTELPANENATSEPAAHYGGPDPHGQAALLLVESLVHGLMLRSVLSVDDAIEIVDVAAEVKEEVAAEMGDTRATMEKSLSLLGAIRLSLSNDAAAA